MRTLAFFAALTLITLSTKCNVFVSLTLKDIILKHKAGMTTQDYKTLIESNGFSSNITKISARTSKGTDVADIFYHQVDMYVDYHFVHHEDYCRPSCSFKFGCCLQPYKYGQGYSVFLEVIGTQ
jgi:hypothetical protein